MSTTSTTSCCSSECNGSRCRYCSEDSYGRNNQPGLLCPFYKTMGQPLVYYAQIQQQTCKPKTMNCFAKAFKWYSKDSVRGRKQGKVCPCPDVSGFATWLDSKYSEFLRESDAQQISQQTQPQSQSQSIPISNIDTTSCPPCQTTPKRSSRLRSPWSRRRSSNKNAGDQSCKLKSPNASCQFILQPPDLTRPASETCFQTLTSCRNKSNTRIIPHDVNGTKEGTVKSRSMTSICSQNSTRNCIDSITVQEGYSTIRPVLKSLSPCDQKCKVGNKIKETTNIEERHQKPADSQIWQMPCDPTNVIKTEPCKMIHQIPIKSQSMEIYCDQKCKAQQNFQEKEITEKVPSKSQTVEIPCSGSCTSKQVCKVVQEVIQLPNNTPTHSENSCTTKDKSKLREDLLLSLSKSHNIENPHNHLPGEVKSQLTNIRNYTNEEKFNNCQAMFNMPLNVLEPGTCNINCNGKQEYQITQQIPVDHCLNYQECNIRAKTVQRSSGQQPLNLCDQNIKVNKNYIQVADPPIKSDDNKNVGQSSTDTRIPAQTRGPILSNQLYKKIQQKKEIKIRNSLKSTDIECQCPADTLVNKEMLLPRVLPPIKAGPPSNYIRLERIPPMSAETQSPLMALNGFGTQRYPMKNETDLCHPNYPPNMAFNQNTSVISAISENPEFRCEHTCPLNFRNHTVQQLPVPSVKTAIKSHNVFDSKTRQRPTKTKINMQKVSSKCKTDHECQCPEENLFGNQVFQTRALGPLNNTGNLDKVIGGLPSNTDKIRPLPMQVTPAIQSYPQAQEMFNNTGALCNCIEGVRTIRERISQLPMQAQQFHPSIQSPLQGQRPFNNTDVSCKCTEGISTITERILPLPLQMEQYQRAIQPQNPQDVSHDSASYAKKNTGHVSSSYPEKDIIQYDNSCPLHRCIQAKIKSNHSHYTNNINSTRTNGSSRYFENTPYESSSVYERRSEVKNIPIVLYTPRHTNELTNNVSCQCSEKNILHNDLETRDGTSVCPKLVKPTALVCNVQKTSSFAMKSSVHATKISNSMALLKNDSVQTSDHAISFENKQGQDYAFFMKIVCADKLNNGLCGNKCWT